MLICATSEVPQDAPSKAMEVELFVPSEVPQASPLEVEEARIEVLDALLVGGMVVEVEYRNKFFSHYSSINALFGGCND